MSELRAVAMAVVLVLVPAGCGGGGLECVSGPAEVGDVEVDVLGVEWIDDFDVYSPRGGAVWFGVRLRGVNETGGPVQPLLLARSHWPEKTGWRLIQADGLGWGESGPSFAWAALQGDDDPETMVGAGVGWTTWLLYEVPEGAYPVGLDIDGEVCLDLAEPRPALSD